MNGLAQSPTQRRRRVPKWSVIALGVIALGCLAALAGNRLQPANHFALTGPAYAVRAPQTAADLQRDPAAEAVRKSDIDDLVRSLGHAIWNGSQVSAYYVNPGAHTMNGVVPPGVLFVGARLDHWSRPRNLVKRVAEDWVKAGGGQTVEVDPGEHGGEAMCAEVHNLTACAWATRTSFGALIFHDMRSSITDAADTMRRIRADVEQPA